MLDQRDAVAVGSGLNDSPAPYLDPHSPNKGFWHSFCGHHLWRREDFFDYNTYRVLCPELTARPWLVWFDKQSTMWSIQIVFALAVYDTELETERSQR